MPSSPRQRLPRDGRDHESAAPLVDPETVAAVRQATLAFVGAVATGGSTASRSVARASVVAGKWLGPRLVELGVAIAKGLWWAASGSASWLWTQRGGVVRLMHRGLWWGALAILLLVGRALLSTDGNPELVEAALLWFCAGLSMSVLVLVGAPETRMRVAAFALAGGHGSLAALAWLVAGA